MVLKKYFLKHKSKVIIDRNYQNFERDKFRVEIDNDILTCDLYNIDILLIYLQKFSSNMLL